MLRESLKWMLLTLIVAGTVTVCGILGVRALRRGGEGTARSTPQPVPAENTAEAVWATEPPAQEPEPTPEPTRQPDLTEQKARALMESMTLEEKLGQLVMFGFSGASRPEEAFLALMDEYHVGNVMLYGANIASNDSDGGFGRASRLTAALNQGNDSQIPLWIGIDVEGGSVVRFTWNPWPSSARTLGRRDPSEARAQFETIGSALSQTGIHLDLAPVLDVAKEPMNTFLKTRMISSDQSVAAAVGAAVIDGLHEGGCLSAAKHFPGHGGAAADSHDTTPVITKSLEELRAYDLVPFQAAVDAGVDVILVAHISYPSVDAERIATQSPVILQGLLREEMGFEGVIMSDDFRMAGLTSQADAGSAAVQFLLSGGDLILCGPQYSSQRAILQGLYAACADGTLSPARIDQSVMRILLKKLSYFGY